MIVRATDTEKDLLRKIRLATILGTIQSSFTHFKYIRTVWETNCKEERLLGVSMTGIMDSDLMNGRTEGLEERLVKFRKHAVGVNDMYAKRLGIPPSAAVTCVKPAGTVSQLTNTASGIHPRHSKYYLRTVRCDKKDPMYAFLKDQGVPVEDEIMKPDSTAVFTFAIESPDTSVFRDDLSAIEQLRLWKMYALNWCEHKPSITVTVREHEWMAVGAWVYENFEIMSGISFLPHSDHTYLQAPYQEVSQEEWQAVFDKVPKKIDWELLSKYEKTDRTAGAKTYACTGGACEQVDLV